MFSTSRCWNIRSSATAFVVVSRRHLRVIPRPQQQQQQQQRMLYSATPAANKQQQQEQSSIADTPLGNTKEGRALLDGLDVYSVPARGDGHPLSVYGIDSQDPQQAVRSNKKEDDDDDGGGVRPILLLHGRTWSSVPVYHLLGGGGSNGRKEEDGQQQQQHESRSLMEALKERGLQPYTMDFRGFGGTPRDATGCVEPLRCVLDAESVLEWIIQRHSLLKDHPPALLGWSQGAMVAQLAAQKSSHHSTLMSKLILYGSIYDPLVRYPREPLYSTSTTSSRSNQTMMVKNHLDAAMEDFTIEGTIPPEPAFEFAEAALIADPIKAVWKHLYQFNNCDPARVHVPTLVVAGDQDPYAPLHVQQDLFSNLGRGSDRTWSILADADHAAHLLDGRARFANIVASFVFNGKRSENVHHYY